MLQECADELLLLSDMLATFSRSDAGVSRAHCESVAKRIRHVAERLRDGRRPSGAVTAASHSDEPAGSIPHPPSFLRANAANSTDAAPNCTARLPAMRPSGGSPRAGPPPESQRPSHHLTITKPNSVRVAPIARETLTSGPSFDATRAAACALYNILENITWLLHSTSASVYVRDGEEMVSIVNVSPKLVFPPRLLRHVCHGSLSAGVLASGITLNQRTVDPRRPPTSTLIVPIYNETTAVCSTPIAVVQVEGKHQGRSAYTEADELTLCFGARLLGLVISRFQIDWQAAFHDPMSQHNLAPFRPVLFPSNSVLAQSPSSTPAPGEVKVFADALDGFTQQKFVKRVVLPMNQAASAPERVQGLGPAPTLKEIDSYVNNLHDCWKKSVEMNVAQSQTERQRMKEMKHLREELAQQKAKYTQVSETLRIHMLDSNDYKQEYQSLRQELEAYLRSKDRMD
jgi:hypothetical protein